MLTTLVYLSMDDQYLMLHRNKKEDDINYGKWIGVGGKFERGESPVECARREVLEETGQELMNEQYRGMVTFLYPEEEPIYMFLYTGSLADKQVRASDEGELAWIDRDEISKLELWEGDRLFLQQLLETEQLIDMKLAYDRYDRLVGAYDFAGEVNLLPDR